MFLDPFPLPRASSAANRMAAVTTAVWGGYYAPGTSCIESSDGNSQLQTGRFNPVDVVRLTCVGAICRASFAAHFAALPVHAAYLNWQQRQKVLGLERAMAWEAEVLSREEREVFEMLIDCRAVGQNVGGENRGAWVCGGVGAGVRSC